MLQTTMTVRFAAFTCGAAVLLLAGCGSTTEGDAEPTGGAATTTGVAVAANVPTGFDPCTDVTQEVLDSEQLHTYNGEPNITEVDRGAIKWRGCAWLQSDGYAVSIETTNLTIDMVRDKGFADPEEYTINDRAVLMTRQSPDRGPDNKWTCTLNAEMDGGSLEMKLSNFASAPKTAHLDACDGLLRPLADKVVPLIPAGA